MPPPGPPPRSPPPSPPTRRPCWPSSPWRTLPAALPAGTLPTPSPAPPRGSASPATPAAASPASFSSPSPSPPPYPPSPLPPSPTSASSASRTTSSGAPCRTSPLYRPSASSSSLATTSPAPSLPTSPAPSTASTSPATTSPARSPISTPSPASSPSASTTTASPGLSPLRLPPTVQDLDLSSNRLSGPVPAALTSFPAASFAGNPALCGAPLAATCPASPVVASDPTRPGASSSSPPAVVSSSPGSKPEGAPAAALPAGGRRGGKMSRAAVIAIVAGDFAVLLAVCGLLFLCFWRKYAGDRHSELREGEKIVFSSSPYAGRGGASAAPAAAGAERGRMVFLEGAARRFELEDLLRASAEMLGKGGYGTAYKAVLDDGSVVAVKRLREAAGGVGRKEFEQHVEVVGRTRHPNVVPLKAYYYARDEKLLVYDYMPGGSLFSLLHANRGPGRTPLDWTTRMRIAAGAARGLAFIHHSNRAFPKLAHGNIKSSNVLLDKSGNAHISDFGLPLLGPMTVSPRSNGYRAPECNHLDAARPKPAQKADVYAFGVLLLELLTGKYPSQVAEGMGAAAVDLPRWVQSLVREEWTAEVFDLELMRYKDIEEEMVAMLQIAMACTTVVAEQRPSMGHVLKLIEEIRGGEASPSHESFDSVSDSPSVSEEATV